VRLEQATGDVGDVCLSTPIATWFAFARGNVSVRMTTEQVTASPLRSVAKQFENALISRPTGVPTIKRVLSAPPPGLARAGPATAEIRGSFAELDREVGAEKEAPCIKIYIRGGSVALTPRVTVFYEAPKVEIEAFVLSPGAAARSHEHLAPTSKPKQRKKRLQ